MLARHRASGDLAPRGHGGGRQKTLSDAHRRWLLKIVLDEPDMTLADVQARSAEKKKLAVSVPTLSRELRALNLRRKKNQWLLVSETEESAPGTGDE